ncbi:MAG: RNA-binding protein [Bacteroidales bacterium]|jgi:RNA recognition motif-containing protein|nr:RNA-binding protein [Bacteroidales bacterium]MDD4001563.1 RNA-binding protein [Bacteroidales bacterium]MDD4528381.1 RNA-binding protein [Bacteroidales bacterium]MDD4828994.1 RNA-binding protein [Bacteroidales bacterium]
MNIFVSNLSYAINDDDLRQAFEEYGEVSSAKVITDKFTGRSRGFGFVEMSDEHGQKAIEELNGASFDKKVISVAVARPREDRAEGGNRGGGGFDRNQRGRSNYNSDRY